MHKLQVRKCGRIPHTTSSNRSRTQESACCVSAFAYGPEQSRFISGVRRAFCLEGAGDSNWKGAWGAGGVALLVWAPVRCVHCRSILPAVYFHSRSLLYACCAWQRVTYKVICLFTSEEFWKSRIYYLFNLASCFYFHLMLSCKHIRMSFNTFHWRNFNTFIILRYFWK